MKDEQEDKNEANDLSRGLQPALLRVPSEPTLQRNASNQSNPFVCRVRNQPLSAV
jgi:hypothetical protein